MLPNDLASCFMRHRTDKLHRHRYETIYEWLLQTLRDVRGLRLLEIGVQHGRSLRAWEDYLPDAEIHGVDIDPACLSLQFTKAVVHIGDACDSAFMKSLGNFDIVIDDGDHSTASQTATFNIMWPHTRMLYVVEDLEFDRSHAFAKRAAAHAVESSKTLGRDNVSPYWTLFAGELVAFIRNTQLEQRGLGCHGNCCRQGTAGVSAGCRGGRPSNP